ncbi:MAG: glycosyltransferase, partial [Terracidiphilus sp.]
MSSTVIGPSYIRIDAAATDSLTSAGQAKSTPDKFGLVIPTLREAENIGGLLDHVRSVLDPVGICYEILVVDDDSQDGTEGIVSAISRQDGRV